MFTAQNTLKISVLGFRDCVIVVIFSARPVRIFGARIIDNKILTLLQLPRSNAADCLIVSYMVHLKY
jgi:hypothetical protein